MSRVAPFTTLAACALATAFAASAAGQVPGWPSEAPPAALAPTPTPTPFPPYEVRSLPNGLRVVVVRHTEQPVVSAQMLIMAGYAFDAAGKGGLSNLVAALLDQGTATRKAGEIARTVDAAGAELSVLSGADATFVQMTVMADGLGFGLDVLSSVVRTPSFAREELERQRQQLRAALRVSYTDPAYIADAVFARLVFGLHPYGRPGDGTPESVAQITRDDLVAFHRQYYVPNRCLLAIVGDVEVPDAFAAAERVFGGWEAREVLEPWMPAPPPPAARLVVVDAPGSAQTEIRAGHLGMPRNSPDFVPMDLGLRILGGEGGNRLLQALRTERGLAYDAYAGLDTYRSAGVVRASADTPSPATPQALKILVDEFSKAKREPVSDKALTHAKSFVAGSYPLGLETPGSISTKVLDALFHERPLDELQTHAERIGAVTGEDVTRALTARLHPDRLIIVLVGHADTFVPQLKSVGFKDVEVLPLAVLDLGSGGLRRTPVAPGRAGQPMPGPNVPLMASRDDWVRARSVVRLAIGAAGGLDALSAVKTTRAVAETVLHTAEGPLTARTATVVEYPDRFRIEMQTPGGPLVQVYDAGRAWLSDTHGPRDTSEAMRRDFAALARRDWIPLLLAASAEQLTGRRLSDETGPGGKALLVVELWNDDRPAVRVAVDAATGRLAWLSYQVPGPAGLETVTETFGTFKSVGGLLMPHTVVTRRDGVVVLERTVSELTVNPVLPAGLFDKPR